MRHALFFSRAAVVLCAAALTASANESVAGLRAQLEIVRDREGVPHIRAANETDAYFGLGYAHATDRLWQMEYLRRLATGRLSEVTGAASVPADRLFLTLGIRDSAKLTWANYGARQRELVSAYVRGVNALLNRKNQPLPLEFQLLGFRPEPWREEDVLATAKLLSWTVDRNWNQELLRTQLTAKVGAERAAQLMPAYSAEDPVITESGDRLAAAAAKPASRLKGLGKNTAQRLLAFDRQILKITGLGGDGLGSNNWVLNGRRTVTGAPILASDPHLPSQIPAVFYAAHITGGSLDAIGATVAGMPGIVMGHNGRIAWGWTNANADVQDLYVERIHDDRDAEYNGSREPLTIRNEVIKVRGAADVPLRVRSTRHGPLISDLVDPTGPALAIRWAAVDNDDDIGIGGYLDANRASDWESFKDCFRRLKAHPQNLVYADVDGNIGYLLPGTIPIRRAHDGSAPVPGWTSQFEWGGYVPAQELPSVLNPQGGYLASANNRIAGDRYQHIIGTGYAAPYRAQRVAQMLAFRNVHSVKDMESMQGDVLSLQAAELLPLLAGMEGSTPLERQALDMLRRWDRRVTADSAAAAVYESWMIELARSVFADELGEPLWRSYSEQLHMVSMALTTAINKESRWCDVSGTPELESCQNRAMAALRAGLTRMAEAQGTQVPANWQWGRVHRTIFFHAVFDGDPQLRPVFNRYVPNGGDKHTVNVASNPAWAEYDQRHVALYRQIIDLKDFSNSRWMIAPGESGKPFEAYYDDMIDEWQRVEFRPMLFAKEAVENGARERLLLTPGSAGVEQRQ